MNPIVSIIMTTYNGKDEWISNSIDSVLEQSFKDFEFIIINDSSTNNVEDIILKYAKKDNRIVYVKNQKNLKLPKSLNKGINLSKGKYLARIDDDDVWNDKKKLEKQLKFLDSHPEYGLCGSEFTIYINEDGKEVDCCVHPLTDFDIRQHILISNQFSHSSVVFTKEAIDNVGGYDENYLASQDYDLWCRIGCKYKFANIKGVSILYRLNGKGIGKLQHRLQYKNTMKIFRKNRNNYPNFIPSFIHKLIEMILPKKCIKFLMSTKKYFLNCLKNKLK